ncbi:hypothetical protein [Actinoplanes sp. NPDC051411]|uniref:hypothetical protein n=1 Tax=Actinoplanes sp. NPDC051411 TaxID=3155522 RepID=UPI003422553D
MLTITSLGVFAGITIGAGPAMAAANTGQGAVKSSTADATAKPGDRVAGYYDSRIECRIAGRIGDRLGRWDDWNCYPARGGWHDGDWVLVVDYSWHGGGSPFDHDGFPFNNDHHHHGGPFHDQHHGMKGTIKAGAGNNVGMPSATPNTN